MNSPNRIDITPEGIVCWYDLCLEASEPLDLERLAAMIQPHVVSAMISQTETDSEMPYTVEISYSQADGVRDGLQTVLRDYLGALDLDL